MLTLLRNKVVILQIAIIIDLCMLDLK